MIIPIIVFVIKFSKKYIYYCSHRWTGVFGSIYCYKGILMEKGHHKNRIFTSQWSITKSLTRPIKFDLSLVKKPDSAHFRTDARK